MLFRSRFAVLIAFEKVAVIAEFIATPVVLFAGVVDDTVGAVVSAAGGEPPPPPPQAARKPNTVRMTKCLAKFLGFIALPSSI